MFYLAFITSLVTAIFFTLTLKVLSFFKFIKWSPVGYTDRHHILEESHPFIQWVFLAVMIFLVTLVFYLIMQHVALVPPFLSSLIIGGVFALIVEWVIFDLPAELSSFKKLSIPFMICVIIASRFVFETATFHYQANEERNKLPYKESMIK